jgi:hypothetical protein
VVNCCAYGYWPLCQHLCLAAAAAALWQASSRASPVLAGAWRVLLGAGLALFERRAVMASRWSQGVCSCCIALVCMPALGSSACGRVWRRTAKLGLRRAHRNACIPPAACSGEMCVSPSPFGLREVDGDSQGGDRWQGTAASVCAVHDEY